MSISYNEKNQFIRPFIEEVEKYVKGVHVLEQGAVEGDILDFEKKYKLVLPSQYKEFLKLFNGGELFATPAGTVFSRLVGSGVLENGIPYLEKNFENRWPEMPESFLIIADTNYGDVICIDIASTDKTDTRIVKWDHESGEVSAEWNSLIDFLMSEMEIGAYLVDYDGNDL